VIDQQADRQTDRHPGTQPEMDVNQFTGLPRKQALYDPQFESDACGVGFVVNIDGIRSQKVSSFLDLRLILLVNYTVSQKI